MWMFFFVNALTGMQLLKDQRKFPLATSSIHVGPTHISIFIRWGWTHFFVNDGIWKITDQLSLKLSRDQQSKVIIFPPHENFKTTWSILKFTGHHMKKWTPCVSITGPKHVYFSEDLIILPFMKTGVIFILT